MATDDDEDRAVPVKPNPAPSPDPVAVLEDAMLPNILPVPGGGGKVRCCCRPDPGMASPYDIR